MKNVQGRRIALLMPPNEVNPLVQVPADVLTLEGLYSGSNRKPSRTGTCSPLDSMSRRGTDPVWPTEANRHHEPSH